MSFRINTNVAAQGALRNVTASTNMLNKSINRLSTGLRINNAADDPAGLIASEGFRAQISSLEQAVRNNQDAVNYSKTAEGALTEVNTLLNDARTLAVASANSGTLTQSQVQANQDQLGSIVESITRISQQTQYGTKKLLDGSSGITSTVSDAAKVSSLDLSGSLGGTAITANADVSLAVTTAAEKATVTATGNVNTAGALASGSVSLNGTSFAFDKGATAAEIATKFNEASSQTGVTASVDATSGQVKFDSVKYGANAKIELVDAAGVISTAAGAAQQDAGVNAVATLSSGAATTTITGGQGGADGLSLSDGKGNTVRLAEQGNATNTAAVVGRIALGAAQFQIGANAGQSAQLSLGNFGSSSLGGGVVSGKTLNNLDLSSATGAADAMAVIDKAIEQVSNTRGRIGNFQRNVLESNIRSLGVAKENLSATESSIRDTDVAEEMSRYTKAQILQQAGLSVLGQANSSPQSVLNLIR